MSNNFALKEYFFCGIFLNESSSKALSEHLEIKNFENSPFLTLADTFSAESYNQYLLCVRITTYPRAV